VAREESVGLVPFFLTGVAANPKVNQADGIHPTAEGYRVVVDHIFPYLIEAIKSHKAN
jgi:acyl-CoA thioesterase-1